MLESDGRGQPRVGGVVVVRIAVVVHITEVSRRPHTTKPIVEATNGAKHAEIALISLLMLLQILSLCLKYFYEFCCQISSNL